MLLLTAPVIATTLHHPLQSRRTCAWQSWNALMTSMQVGCRCGDRSGCMSCAYFVIRAEAMLPQPIDPESRQARENM